MNMIPTPFHLLRTTPEQTCDKMYKLPQAPPAPPMALRTSLDDEPPPFSRCGRGTDSLRWMYMRLEMSNLQATMGKHASPSIKPTLFRSS
jgi:hypothetical protein